MNQVNNPLDSKPLQKNALPASFKNLAWSNLAAQSAEQICLAAVPLVAVLKLNAGAGETGLIIGVQSLPFLIASIPLGLLADRVSRRGLMIASEFLRFVAFVGLLLAVLLDQVSLPLLATLGFIGAIGTVGFSVAAPSLVPSLVPRESLAIANGRLELARSLAFAGGPAVAGTLVSWAGASTAFVVASVLSVAAIVFLWRIAEPSRPEPSKRHPLTDLREGARMVWNQPLLKPMLLTSIIWNLAWFVLQAAYVPYAIRVLGMSASIVGISLATCGAGMVLGALLAQRLLQRVPFGIAVTIGPVVSVLGSLTMFATLWFPSPVLAGFSFFLFGVGPIIWTISTTTLRQTITPQAMLGRVSAIFLTVNAGARPIGAAIGAMVGATWGEAACLGLSLAGFILQAVVVWISKIKALKSLPSN
jgi:predicted MFS family arabinose efflux permease